MSTSELLVSENEAALACLAWQPRGALRAAPAPAHGIAVTSAAAWVCRPACRAEADVRVHGPACLQR